MVHSPTARISEQSSEFAMLRALGELLQVKLAPGLLSLPDNLRVEVQGIDDAESVLVQLASHEGVPRAAHRMSSLADMFKLVWLRGVLPTRPRLVMCVTEPQAKFFTSASWPIAAAHDMNIDIYAYRADGSLELLTGQQLN